MLCLLILYGVADENISVRHGLPILLADFLGQLNHNHISWMTIDRLTSTSQSVVVLRVTPMEKHNPI